MYYFDGITTPIGRLHVVVSDNALVRLYLPNESWSDVYVRKGTHPLIVQTKRELNEYFRGMRKTFTIPISLEGTSFQKSAWKLLQIIPYGKTIRYSDEARRIGNPRAVRAVGSANGKNPIPIIVPCHRVVPKGGGTGGYRGGEEIKKLLIALEQSFEKK